MSQQNTSASPLRVALGLSLCVISAGLLIPTAISYIRKQRHLGSIVLWNTAGLLLLGMGWMIALANACFPDRYEDPGLSS